MSMVSKMFTLSKNSIIYGIGVVAAQLVGFILLPLYTRYLSPDAYANLEILTVTQNILSIIFIMGFSSSIFTYYFNYKNQKSRDTIVSSSLIFLTIMSAILSMSLFMGASLFSQGFFQSNDFTRMFQIIFLIIFFETCIIIPLSIMRAREEPKKFVAISLARFFMAVSLNIYFVAILERGVTGILESTLITVVVLYIFLIPGIIKQVGLGYSKTDVKRMLIFGLPLVPAGIGSLILTAVDRYFLLFLSTPHELGLYSIGYKFGFIVQALVVGPFALAWGPFFWSIAKKKGAKRVYGRVLTYFLAATIFVAVGLSVMSKEIIQVMTTTAYADAYQVIPLIAISYVFYGSYTLLNAGFMLKKKTKFIPVIIGASVCINLVLNWFLIPDYGMMGAAISTVISYAVLPVSSLMISRRFNKINYEWGRVAKLAGIGAGIFIMSLYIPEQTLLISIILNGSLLILYPVLALYLVFRPKERREIIGFIFSLFRRNKVAQ